MTAATPVDSVLGRLFVSDALLPSQFAGRVGACRNTPEARLRLAVVEQAIADARDASSGGAADRRRADALRWLCDTEQGWPYSFAALCEAFGWDAERVRAAVLARAA